MGVFADDDAVRTRAYVFLFAHFSVTDKVFLNDPKKLSTFGCAVQKGRLVKTVTASFNTTTGQMTEMFR